MSRATKDAGGSRCAAPGPFDGAVAALFDLDGTLIETHIDFPRMKREVLAAAARYGVDADALEPLDILTAVEAGRDRLSGQGDAGDRLRAECFAILRDIEVEQCARPVRIEGAAPLVRRIQDMGIPVGVVTRNSRAVSERLLEQAKIVPNALVTRDDVARTKPDPMHLFEALARLGIAADAADRCVMVGDHPMDIQAGRAAGMRTIAVVNGGRRQRFEGCPPDWIASTTDDLLRLLPARPCGRPTRR
jgi:phosphoglycolate phosphatase